VSFKHIYKSVQEQMMSEEKDKKMSSLLSGEIGGYILAAAQRLLEFGATTLQTLPHD
jgi:hypothetical protein